MDNIHEALQQEREMHEHSDIHTDKGLTKVIKHLVNTFTLIIQDLPLPY